MAWVRAALVIGACIVFNSDPYGQASLVSWLPWGPDARSRRKKKKS